MHYQQTDSKSKKDFSIMKWLIFPLIALLLAVGIGVANCMMFGFWGSFLYLCLLVCIFIISLIMVFQTGNKRLPQAIIAAFSFETIGLVALLATCLTAVYFTRTVQGAATANQSTTEVVKEIKGLKSSKAQNNITKNMNLTVVNVAEVYEKAEKFMLWTLASETLVYFAGLMVLFGINLFCVPKGLTTNDDEEPVKTGFATVKLGSRQAPLKATAVKYAVVSNGVNSFRFRLQRGRGSKVQVSWRGNGAELFCKSVSTGEAEVMQYMDYNTLATELIKSMKTNGLDSKSIEDSL